jgi:hypothetical protein
VSVRIYVEGGGDHRRTLDACRQAFAQFFSKIAPVGARPRVIAAGDGTAAFNDFCNALTRHPDNFVLLLVDSEDPVSTGTTAWHHLEARTQDGWSRPTIATDEQAHLMVQCMEAWFLADRATLAAYYGHEFLVDSLPGQPKVELIAKRDVIRALQHASRPTQKGEYRKTGHGFELLERIDPDRVREASAHAARLFAVLTY